MNIFDPAHSLDIDASIADDAAKLTGATKSALQANNPKWAWSWMVFWLLGCGVGLIAFRHVGSVTWGAAFLAGALIIMIFITRRGVSLAAAVIAVWLFGWFCSQMPETLPIGRYTLSLSSCFWMAAGLLAAMGHVRRNPSSEMYWLMSLGFLWTILFGLTGLVSLPGQEGGGEFIAQAWTKGIVLLFLVLPFQEAASNRQTRWGFVLGGIAIVCLMAAQGWPWR